MANPTISQVKLPDGTIYDIEAKYDINITADLVEGTKIATIESTDIFAPKSQKTNFVVDGNTLNISIL